MRKTSIYIRSIRKKHRSNTNRVTENTISEYILALATCFQLSIFSVFFFFFLFAQFHISVLIRSYLVVSQQKRVQKKKKKNAIRDCFNARTE